MKVCFMGSMDFAVPILEGLHKKYGVILVVTQPDRPFGRKQVLKSTPVKIKATELGIEVFQPERIRKDNDRIMEEEFDLIIVAAYGQLIPEKVLFHGRYQAINVHASLLPKYRGGSPMHKAIMDGEKNTGVSIIFMEKSLDSGAILSQAEIEIGDSDNVKDLEDKLSYLGRDLLLDTIEKLLVGKIEAKAQDEKLVSYAYNLKNEDTIIDFKTKAKQINNFVRGLNPWPIAYFFVGDTKIKVFEVEVIDKDISENCGEVVVADKSSLMIQTKAGLISLKRLQMSGKKEMNIKDFMNGAGKQLFYEGLILN
jgi:methionyl-tRNA formyltransferase